MNNNYRNKQIKRSRERERERERERDEFPSLGKILFVLVLFSLSITQTISAASSASATFSGTTNIGAVIYVRVNDLPGSTTVANETGYFKKTIEGLDTGLHTVLIYATDDKGRRSKEFIMGFVIPKEALSIAISDINLDFPPQPKPDCRGNPDLNKDGKVNLFDFSILMYNWGIPKNCEADQNQDGQVNFTDFSIFISKWKE